jgi:hypothetical protein
MSKESNQAPTLVAPTLNVYQRIHAVMRDMETIKKRGRNDFHKYDYATEADFVHALRPLLDKHRLVVVPQLSADPVHSAADEKGNVVSSIIMKFWIVNIDDPKDQACVVVPAQGQDKGDKALYKAMTGAKKYFAALTFMVATGDDPEKPGPDEQTNRRGVKSRPRTSAATTPNDEF